MGVGGISMWQLLIILVIVILLFGTKRLRTLGTDLGASLRGFKQAMKDGEDETLKPDEPPAIPGQDSANRTEASETVERKERS